MIKNYFKTAWRNLAQNKTTSLISVAGLAVGICCFLLLATYLINELRYDRFHDKAARIARLTYAYQSSNDAQATHVAVTPTAPVPVFKQQLSEIERGVRVYNYTGGRSASIQYGDKLFSEKKMLVADEDFFKIFSFKFIAGNPAKALSDPSSVVISASAAKKYFGNDDPIGKILKVNTIRNLMVTGVIADIPEYSQIKFDMIGSYAMMDRSQTRDWDSANDYSYLLLKPGANLQSVQQKITAYVKNRFNEKDKAGYGTSYILEPLTRVHLYSTAQGGLEPSGNIKYIYILGLVAVILLVLACVNFLNLVTARSAERAREIGVRKVMGAQRSQLFFQFITEAAIITLVSLITGVFLAAITFPTFSTFSGQQLGFITWNLTWLGSAVLALFIIVTLLAGTYPSLYLSAFKPVVTLKGGKNSSAGGNTLRKSLVVFQFVVSVFFIIGTIIAAGQLNYMQGLNTGMDRQQVMVLDIGGMPYADILPLKNEVSALPGVQGITASYNSPVNITGGYSINSADGKNSDYNLSVVAMPVEKSFVKTIGIKLVQGNDLDLGDEQQAQLKEPKYSFILNETAIKALGWKPQEAIGKHIGLNGRMGTVKAVAKDFNFSSLHEAIAPIAIFPEFYWFGKVLIKTNGKNTAQTIKDIQSKWHSLFPNAPLEYHFLDQEFEAMYKTDQRTGSILAAFTGVTIFISCLGLFGLAVFSTRQRVKEIGIRKVLGASVLNITGLVSLDFIKLVVAAVIIASPLAYYFMSKWLQDFAYRIHIQWWVFALAGLAAIVIAFITVGYQSVKAALANPVKSLRSE